MLIPCRPVVNPRPVCSKSADGIVASDFLFYDKDGFELNIAEQKFYRASGFPLNDVLNHLSWQEQWFTIESNTLMLDHCIILHRCSYDGDARDQLMELAKDEPRARLLVQTRAKWGYDLALDAVAPSGEVFEVLHVEQDSTDYNDFMNRKERFEDEIFHIDWGDVAARVWERREQWRHLQGFEQNNWKSKFILGWSKAESIEKCV